MGNIVGTILWTPTNEDHKIILDLGCLTSELSLSVASPNIRVYEKGKTSFGAENAGLWRAVISDEQVDHFLRRGREIVERYGINDARYVKENLAI